MLLRGTIEQSLLAPRRSKESHGTLLAKKEQNFPMFQISAKIRFRHRMTDGEKKAYIGAELCLMSLPANMGFPDTQTRWDELQYVHVRAVSAIHHIVSPLRIPHLLRC